MNDGKYFLWVDFATWGLPAFRNNVVHVGDLCWLAKRYAYTECFSTYFLFDSGLQEHVKGNGHSVSGYQGPCHAHYLPLDIDSPDLGQALETARGISRYFLDKVGVPEEAVVPYYSGMKGFHLSVATRVFGDVKPSVELPKTFREIRKAIVQESGVSPDAVDFAISDRMRLLRLPNTRHSKSGLYKVPLKVEELLSAEPEEIRRIAEKPRETWLTDESGMLPRHQVEPVPDAVEMFYQCAEQAERKSYSDLPAPASFLARGDLDRALCRAELELYREGVSQGARSAMTLRLASRMRSAGYAKEETSEMIESFAGRCDPPLDGRTARRIVGVAYSANGNGYQFGCGTGNGDPAHTRVVREHCPYADRTDCETFKGFTVQLRNGKDARK
jgi:hypothetical protein